MPVHEPARLKRYSFGSLEREKKRARQKNSSLTNGSQARSDYRGLKAEK